MNAYDRLLQDLRSGELNLTHIDLAVVAWINSRTDIPEGIKNILVQPEGGGVLRTCFKQAKQIIGTMELSYRRGVMEGSGEYK